ncbi:hypothetical protein GCM10027418_15180 [Mariniluteicoccus endophyticus]
MTERRPEDFDRDFADIVGQIEASRMKEPEHGWLNLEDAIDDVEVPEPPEEEWKPAPLPPPSHPSALAAVGWTCAAYAVAVVLLTIFRVSLPPVLGYLAIAAFVAALVIGFLKLPRDRDPYDGDGAVV